MIFNYLNISWIFQFLVGHYYLEYTVKNKNLWDISLFSAVVSVHFRPYVKSSQYLLVERILVVLYLSLSPMSILLAPLDFLTKRQIRKKNYTMYIVQASWSESMNKYLQYIVLPSFGYTWCCIAQWWWAWHSWPWVSPWWCWAWPSRSAAVRTEHDRCPDRWRRTGPWGQIYPCSIQTVLCDGLMRIDWRQECPAIPFEAQEKYLTAQSWVHYGLLRTYGPEIDLHSTA